MAGSSQDPSESQPTPDLILVRRNVAHQEPGIQYGSGQNAGVDELKHMDQAERLDPFF
jgi:hypothetical protein